MSRSRDAVGPPAAPAATEPDLRTPPGPDDDAWMAAVRRGDLAAAWTISDAVLRARAGVPCHDRPRHEQYIWDGTPLAGKRVLVRCYHGLGDTVQFIRYVPLLKAANCFVIVWAQPALLPVLRTMAGIDLLLPLHEGVPACAYDVDVEVMELAHVFRTTLDTIPASVPYLHAAPSSVRHRTRDGTRHAGLVWQAGAWDPRRSIPTSLLAPLARVPGVQWHVLQQGAVVEEWPRAWGRVAATGDVMELARRVRALDLLVTVDSFPAHLAGALAVPTCLLLHAAPDWRWMRGRPDSPWYPTMRLFRQRTPGDWASPIEAVRAHLARRS